MPFPADPIAAVVHADPYPYYRHLAVERPLYRDAGLGLWIASDAATVQEVLSHGSCRVRPVSEPVPRHLAGSAAGDIFGRLVRMNDGAVHACTRRVVEAALRPADLRKMAEQARRMLHAVLDTARDQPDGGARIDAAISALPTFAVGALLGLPEELLRPVAGWTGDFVRGVIAPGAPVEQIERGALAASRLQQTFMTLLDSGTGQADGLLFSLRAKAQDCGGLGPEALVANAVGFLSQAHDATAGLLGNGLVALAARPDLHRQVLADPALLPAFVQEVLRHDPPIQNTRRFLADDATLAGQRMAAGDVILVILAAANHDPSANADPGQFAIARHDRRLFTFGFERHACPGEAIATTIATAVLTDLAAAAGEHSAAVPGPVRYRPSVNARIPVFAGAA